MSIASFDTDRCGSHQQQELQQQQQRDDKARLKIEKLSPDDGCQSDEVEKIDHNNVNTTIMGKDYVGLPQQLQERDNEAAQKIEKPFPDDGLQSDSVEKIADTTADTTADTPVVVKNRSLRFQKFKRRFPSYKRVSSRFRKKKVDDKVIHQPLTTIEGEVANEEAVIQHEIVTTTPSLMTRLSSSKSMTRLSSSKSFVDPLTYPLEQITDAEYGRPIDHSAFDDSYLKRQKLRKIIAITGAVIIIAVILGVVLGTTSGRNRSENGNDPHKNGQEPRIVIPEPPADIINICSITTISRPSGKKKCEQICDSVKCCTSGGNETCLVSTENIINCALYDAPCVILRGHESIHTKAPNHLGSFCSDASINTPDGFNLCKSLCLVGQCCFPPKSFERQVTESCWESHQDICRSYTPCLSIQGMRSPIDLVNKYCTTTNVHYDEGREDCEAICKPRKCCFAELDRENCHKDNKSWCDQYEACKVLDAALSHSQCKMKAAKVANIEDLPSECHKFDVVISAIPESAGSSDLSTGDAGNTNRPSGLLKALCAPENLDNIRFREKCETACGERKCCRLSDYERCPDKDESWCDEINACEVVWESSLDETEDYLEGIEECQDFSKLIPSEVDFCTDLCNDYSCCFSGDEMECDGIDCSEGEFCTQIIEECEDFSKLKPAEILFCTNLCDSYSCCFLGDDDLECDGVDCSQGEFCHQTMYYDFDSSDSELYPQTGGPIGGEDGLLPGPHPKLVNVACTSDKISNECYYLCTSYLCCFYDNYDPFSCHASEICAKYSSCSILIDPDSPNEITTNDMTKYYNDESYYPTNDGLYPADEICSIDNLSMNHGLQQCEALCSKHMCCFGGNNACTYRNDCPIYQACGILTDTSLLVKGPEGPLIFNFPSICSSTSLKTIGGKNACTNICKKYECCVTGECKSLGNCDTAAPCGNLHQGETISEVVSRPVVLIDSIPPPVDLQQFCSVDLITSEDPFRITKCLEFCQAAEICKEECDERYEECKQRLSFCDSYVTCHTVWEVDTLNLKKKAGDKAQGSD